MQSNTTTPTKRAPKLGLPEQAVIGGCVLAVVCGWSFLVLRTVYYRGDLRIEFSPFVLAYWALGLLPLLMCLIALVLRRWLLLAISFLSLGICIATLRWGSRIESYAWERSIAANSIANSEALRGIPKWREISPDDAPKIYDDASLAVMPSFQWYMVPHFAAQGGPFRGFRVAGIAHVRLQKVRHGWRGIAFIESPSDLERLRDFSFLNYKPSTDPHWVIWKM